MLAKLIVLKHRSSSGTQKIKNTDTPHSVLLDGSFGKGNLGDDALLQAFLGLHSSDFCETFVVGDTEKVSRFGCQAVSPPPLLPGWRRYRYMLSTQRLLARWKVLSNSPTVYACLGGLLGDPVHVDLRAQMFGLVEALQWRPAYYFGDIEPSCRLDRGLKQIIKFWNRSDSWIGLRSKQAVEMLAKFGVDQDRLFLGVDPVLFERSELLFAQTKRRSSQKSIIAMVPSFWVHTQPETLEWWKMVTTITRDRGLQPKWCIFDESHDVAAARKVCLAAGYSASEFEGQILFGPQAITATEDAELCFTDRYHGAIFPITAGVPTIARGWNGKITRLYSLLCLEEWCAVKDANSPNWKLNLERLVDLALSGQWRPDLSQLQVDLKSHSDALENFRAWSKSS
jgi:polysaccharide pyruvyl transferase WcaK-like protein